MAGEEVGDDDVFSPAERNGKTLPNGAADDKTVCPGSLSFTVIMLFLHVLRCAICISNYRYPFQNLPLPPHLLFLSMELL